MHEYIVLYSYFHPIGGIKLISYIPYLELIVCACAHVRIWANYLHNPFGSILNPIIVEKYVQKIIFHFIILKLMKKVKKNIDFLTRTTVWNLHMHTFSTLYFRSINFLFLFASHIIVYTTEIKQGKKKTLHRFFLIIYFF